MSVDDWTKILGLATSLAGLGGIGLGAYRQRRKLAADERFLEAVGHHDAATRTADTLAALDLPQPVQTEVEKRLDLQRTDNDLKLYRAIAAYEWNKTRQADFAFGAFMISVGSWVLAIIAAWTADFPYRDIVVLICALIGVIALFTSSFIYALLRDMKLTDRTNKLHELADKKHLGIVAPDLPAPDKTTHTVRDWLRRHLTRRK